MPGAGSFYSPIVNAQNEEGPWVCLASLIEIQSLLLSPEWVTSSTDLIFENSRNKYQALSWETSKRSAQYHSRLKQCSGKEEKRWMVLFEVYSRTGIPGMVSEELLHQSWITLSILYSFRIIPGLQTLEKMNQMCSYRSPQFMGNIVHNQSPCAAEEKAVWTGLSSVAQPRTALRSYTCKMQVWDLNWALGSSTYVFKTLIKQVVLCLPCLIPPISNIRINQWFIFQKALWDLCM